MEAAIKEGPEGSALAEADTEIGLGTRLDRAMERVGRMRQRPQIHHIGIEVAPGGYVMQVSELETWTSPHRLIQREVEVVPDDTALFALLNRWLREYPAIAAR